MSTTAVRYAVAVRKYAAGEPPEAVGMGHAHPPSGKPFKLSPSILGILDGISSNSGPVTMAADAVMDPEQHGMNYDPELARAGEVMAAAHLSGSREGKKANRGGYALSSFYGGNGPPVGHLSYEHMTLPDGRLLAEIVKIHHPQGQVHGFYYRNPTGEAAPTAAPAAERVGSDLPATPLPVDDQYDLSQEDADRRAAAAPKPVPPKYPVVSEPPPPVVEKKPPSEKFLKNLAAWKARKEAEKSGGAQGYARRLRQIRRGGM